MSCVLSWLVGKRTKGGPLFVRGKCSLAGLSFLFIANNITLTTVYTVTKLAMTVLTNLSLGVVVGF